MQAVRTHCERAGEAMIDAQTLARQAGFSKFHQRQLRHLIARLARLAYSDGLEDAACECEWAKPVEPTMDALAAGIRAMKTANVRSEPPDAALSRQVGSTAGLAGAPTDDTK